MKCVVSRVSRYHPPHIVLYSVLLLLVHHRRHPYLFTSAFCAFALLRTRSHVVTFKICCDCVERAL